MRRLDTPYTVWNIGETISWTHKSRKLFDNRHTLCSALSSPLRSLLPTRVQYMVSCRRCLQAIQFECMSIAEAPIRCDAIDTDEMWHPLTEYKMLTSISEVLIRIRIRISILFSIRKYTPSCTSGARLHSNHVPQILVDLFRCVIPLESRKCSVTNQWMKWSSMDKRSNLK